MSNKNVTKIERLSSGMVKLYNKSNVIGSFSALNAISVSYENNKPRTIEISHNGGTISFFVYNLQEIIGSTTVTNYDPIDTTDTGSTYESRIFDVFNFLSDEVFQGFAPGPTYVGGVVASYPNFASFPVTGTPSVIYIDEADNSAYYWDGSSYQLLVSTGVEQYANFASFPVTGSANVIYIDMSVPEPYVWDGAAYQSLYAGTISWGEIVGTLSDQTDLQAALDAKFDNPTGTSSDYLDGTGTPTPFPALTGYVPTTRTLTINGTAQDLSADRTWSVGDMLTSVYDTDVDGVVDSAERIQIVVRNSTGSTLTKGQIVYLSGATGNRPNAVLAQANSEATSSKTIGMVIADIPNNSDGQIAVNGTLHDLNTLAFTAGDTLWLSATTPGGMVANTPPSEPNHTVFIGYVARSSPTQGRIVLAIQNGYELDELHGVQITTPTTWQVLRYDSTSGLWINSSLTASIIPSGIDASKIGAGTVDNTEFGYLDGVTSSIQTQLSSKVPTTRTLTINGTAYDLSADRSWTIATGLTIGTTSITSGTIGRVLFEGTGNVLQESAGLYYDSSISTLYTNLDMGTF